MIKKFSDGSYVEIKKSNKTGESVLSLCSIDANNPNIVSVTSVVISIEDLKELVSGLDK